MSAKPRVALAPQDMDGPLLEELGSRLTERRERLFFFVEGPNPVWAQNIWLEPKTFEFRSISMAAKHLRTIQRNWWPHSTVAHRRAQLIQASLPPIRVKAWDFPAELPKAPLGSWTLLDEKTLLYSAQCTSFVPDGEMRFNENKQGPPSRAYLKLWETFALEGQRPQAGERVLDLGSSPGGWTWVLDQLGCHVTSVDKAPLAENLRLSERVTYLCESAFALEPKTIGQVDWLFCDVICYPSRLLGLVRKWMETKPALKFVCTLKFQGPTDFVTIDEFARIPNSHLRHLSCNKHELTWIKY